MWAPCLVLLVDPCKTCAAIEDCLSSTRCPTPSFLFPVRCNARLTYPELPKASSVSSFVYFTSRISRSRQWPWAFSSRCNKCSRLVVFQKSRFPEFNSDINQFPIISEYENATNRCYFKSLRGLSEHYLNKHEHQKGRFRKVMSGSGTTLWNPPLSQCLSRSRYRAQS